MSNQIYFLFGREAATYYFDNFGMPVDELALAIKNMLHATCVYDWALTHPIELLLDYDGWDGFAQIEEELYKKLQSDF